MNYAVIGFDSENGVLQIQVMGCKLITSISIPEDVAQDSQAWFDLIDVAVQNVMANMDPTSPTFDPELIQ